MDEIAAVTPLFAGVNYERLEGYKTLQWPVAPDGTDQPVLYTQQFAFPDGKARLFPLSWAEPQEQPDAEFDLHLNNGRLLEHFHEGNLTYRSPGIREKTPDTFIEISPELARERGIESGSPVQLDSRHGNLRVRALVTDRVQGHELYMPMNSAEVPVNLLTGSHADPATHTPAYKETAVKMRVLSEKRESLCPESITGSGIQRRSKVSKWNGSGVSRAITCPGMGWPKSKLKKERCRRWLNQFHSSFIRARLGKTSVCRMLRRNMRKQYCPHLKCCSCYTIVEY
jgi:formate dehydrogenase major subunit